MSLDFGTIGSSYELDKSKMCVDCFVEDPIWTTRELNRFWAVLEPYVERLLRGDLPLPDHNMDFDRMRSWHQYTVHVHDCLWRGRYTLAVANFRAVLRFCGYQVGTAKCSITDELDLLKDIFIREPLRR